MPDRVLPLLEKSFGAWTAAPSTAAPVTMPAAGQPARRQIYLVDKPGAPQSQIRIGTIGVARATPDFFPIQVMNTILGGSFSSRLNLNLREKRGYTYGASSGFDMRPTPGPFAAPAGVQTDKTAESLKEFFNELNGILQTGAGRRARAGEELHVAAVSRRASRRPAISRRRLEDANVYKLPDDYFSPYVGISKPSPRPTSACRAEIYSARPLAVIVVGDRKTSSRHPRLEPRHHHGPRARRDLQVGDRLHRQTRDLVRAPATTSATPPASAAIPTIGDSGMVSLCSTCALIGPMSSTLSRSV